MANSTKEASGVAVGRVRMESAREKRDWSGFWDEFFLRRWKREESNSRKTAPRVRLAYCWRIRERAAVADAWAMCMVPRRWTVLLFRWRRRGLGGLGWVVSELRRREMVKRWRVRW